MKDQSMAQLSHLVKLGYYLSHKVVYEGNKINAKHLEQYL